MPMIKVMEKVFEYLPEVMDSQKVCQACRDRSIKKPLRDNRKETKMTESSVHNRWLIMVMLSIIVTVGLWGYLFRPLEVHTCVARGGQIVGLDAPEDV